MIKALIKYALPVAIVAMIGACGGGNPEESAQPSEGAAATDVANATGSTSMPMNTDSDMAEMQAMDISGGMDMGGTGGMGDMSGGMDMGGMPHAAMDMPATDDLQQPRLTDQGLYRVAVSPAIDPLPMNQMHGWVIHVETAAGEDVDNATITVDGGMPAHNHGMPTAPKVTANMGNGDYQIEGVQFQMPGHWVVGFSISAGGQEDSVSYNLNLQP